MTDFFLYDTTTGEVVTSGILPKEEEVGLQKREGLEAKKGKADPERQYYNRSLNRLEDKQENPSVLSGQALSELPSPCTIKLEGPSPGEIRVEVGSDASLTVGQAGSYRITIASDNPKFYTSRFYAYLDPEK